jgi:hypothetical protein
MGYTLERKLAIMKSRALHKDNYNAYHKQWIRTNRANSWACISKIFLKILIKDHEQLQQE